MSAGEHCAHNLNLSIDLFSFKPEAISPSKWLPGFHLPRKWECGEGTWRLAFQLQLQAAHSSSTPLKQAWEGDEMQADKEPSAGSLLQSTQFSS